nr:DUF4113 domain-containing protein [Hymenobacter jeollabukensis]
MQCLDQLNARYGSNTVQVATCASQPGRPRPWLGKSAMCSPAYTTRFEELLTVRS